MRSSDHPTCSLLQGTAIITRVFNRYSHELAMPNLLFSSEFRAFLLRINQKKYFSPMREWFSIDSGRAATSTQLIAACDSASAKRFGAR